MAKMSNVVIKSVRAAFKEQKKVMQKAEVAALNRAAKTALSRTIRLIRQKYNLKAKDIREQTKVIRANRNNTKVEIRVANKAIGLIKFGARQTKKGVTAAEQKGRRKTYPNAFIAVAKAGGQAVFIRKTKKRLPIKEMFGPTAMQLFSSKKASDELEKIFYERFKIEFERALAHFSK